MYEIRYNQYHIKLNTIDEVIKQITQIHNEFKTTEPQMILLKFKEVTLELGLGYKYDKILLLFTSGDPLDDSFLSFTGKPLKETIRFERKDLFPFACNENNLIPITAALQEVAYILAHGTRSHQLKWYSN